MLRRALYGFTLMLAILVSGYAGPARAAEKLKVVTTFTILADMVRNVGGEDVTVASLVGPDGDAHVYQPSPADAQLLSQADVVVTNGLSFEGWIDRLVKASGRRGPVIVASQGAASLKAPASQSHAHGGAGQGGRSGHHHHHHHGGLDPHAWQDLAVGRVYVKNIAQALAAADPARADRHRARAEAYDKQIEALDRDVRARFAAIPADRRKVITTHDAFQYYGRAYGVAFRAAAGLSTESEPSAASVAALIRQMKREKIRAVFVENITNDRLLQQIAREADAAIGGKLYSDSLSGPDGPASNYLDMIRQNTSELIKAFSS